MTIYRGTGGSISGVTEADTILIPVSQGGTGATTIVEARLNLNAAKSGVNVDITQLQGLEVPLSVEQGGTGARTAGAALANLGAATAAQGALADTALQEADVATVALTGSYNDLSDKPTAGTGDVVGPTSATDGAVALFDGTTGRLLKDGVVLGSAATTSSTDYATAAQGALADSALQSYTETDPVYLASSWYSTTNNSSNWNTAYGWGNHASAGYLTTYTETDPVFVVHAAYNVTNTKISNWDTAYGWGNHASAGYLTTYTETDPVFVAHAAYNVTNTKITNWDTAYTDRNKWDGGSTGLDAATGRTSLGLGTAATTASTDYATAAQGTKADTAYGWGNHASAGYATNLDGLSDVAITTPSTDQVLKYNGSGWVNGSAPAGGQYFGTATTKAIAYNSQSIAENITVTSGNSGLSAGPITISSGYAVTVASGSRWVIV